MLNHVTDLAHTAEKEPKIYNHEKVRDTLGYPAKVIADQSCFLDTLWNLIFFLLYFLFFFSIFSCFSIFCSKMSKLRCSAFASVILPAAVESCTKRSLILCETITIFFSFSYSGFSVNFLRQSKVDCEKKVERLILFSLLRKYYL